MAKFCKYCGTPLEEGQVCGCPQAQAEAARMQQPGPGVPPQAVPPQPGPGVPPQAVPPQPGPGVPPQPGPYQQPGGYQQPNQYANVPPAAPKAPSPIGMAFKNLLPFLKAYVSSPVNATTTALRQKDIFIPVILLAIQAIVSGLMMFSFFAKLCGMANDILKPVGSALGSLTGSSSGISGALGAAATPTLSASFIMCFLFGLLACVICVVVFAVLAFVVAKLCGSDCSFLQMIIVCGSNSPIVTVLMLLAFLLTFLSIPLGLGLLLFAVVAWMVLSIASLLAVTPNSATGKFWITSVVVVFLALIIGVWATSFMASASLGATAIKVMGQKVYSIGDLMKMAGDMDLGELIGGAFEDILKDALR